ncbi:MAG: YraN family protein [Selenomonadaceae bacterium]|nr:YraN family protein [Selenomonadaceae bacterium]
MSVDKKRLGKEGEDIVVKFLERSGYLILEKNFTAKYGEIDIIAKFGETLHFVEVKTRTSVKYGTPAMAVNAAKQLKIIKTAECYINSHSFFEAPCSFDVAEVFKDGRGNFSIRIIENAFQQ